jgi:hypothetical protein
MIAEASIGAARFAGLRVAGRTQPIDGVPELLLQFRIAHHPDDLIVPPLIGGAVAQFLIPPLAGTIKTICDQYCTDFPRRSSFDVASRERPPRSLSGSIIEPAFRGNGTRTSGPVVRRTFREARCATITSPQRR